MFCTVDRPGRIGKHEPQPVAPSPYPNTFDFNAQQLARGTDDRAFMPKVTLCAKAMPLQMKVRHSVSFVEISHQYWFAPGVDIHDVAIAQALVVGVVLAVHCPANLRATILGLRRRGCHVRRGVGVVC